MRVVIAGKPTMQAGEISPWLAAACCSFLMLVGSLGWTGCANKSRSLEGKEFVTSDGEGIKFRANGEAEVTEREDNVVGKYTVESDGRIRIVVSTLGTDQVTYYKSTQDGLQRQDGALYHLGSIEAWREERRLSASCDGLLHSLDGELANELYCAVADGCKAACNCKEAACVLECTLNRHKDEANPRDKTQRAYVGSGSPSPCQLLLSVHADSRGKGIGVTIQQLRAPGAVMRSYNITVD